MKLFIGQRSLHIFIVVWWLMGFCVAAMAEQSVPQGVALNLSIKHYDRAMTSEGVLRETHYEETMLRRPGHVWVMRVLPKQIGVVRDDHALNQHDKGHEHKHFNSVVLPRHVMLEQNNLKLEFIDREHKERINIAATEYENVTFDGSWINAYFLLDPRQVAAMPLSKKTSVVVGTRWHEQEKNGVFQRVLWDDKNMIPLEIETGTRDGLIFRRVSIKLEPSTAAELPWSNLVGYTQKEYSDFLD